MNIPQGLAAYRQFILHDAQKIPRSPRTGQVCDPHNPAEWVDGPTAVRCASAYQLGVGFVFTEHDPFYFLDIDHCLQADNTWSPAALQLCQMHPGCYIETSMSGTGLHVIASGAPQAHGTRYNPLGLELYSSKRYVALTGNGQGDPCVAGCLPTLVQAYFPPQEQSHATEWTTAPVQEWSGPAEDIDLITRMLSSRPSIGAALGSKATVQQLWDGDAAALSQIWPDAERGYDASAADAALCQHLAFWTGKDCARIDRLFRMSGLMRDKWEERPDYVERTVLRATGACTAVLQSGGSVPDPAPADENGWRTGTQMLTIANQVEYFKGCVYIRDQHKMWVPDGSLLKPDTFRSTYGGYSFMIGGDNTKHTKSAFEAFTESQGYNFPQAHDCCFRPELAPGEVIQEEGRVLMNSYIPIVTERKTGDPAPFLRHVEKLLPLQSDREIILSYMAALVQYPGVKFQWCPLIQGVEGNGKSLLFYVVEHAVGHRYTHLPKAKELSNKFNGWLMGKLFIGVEEIYVPHEQQDIIESLKPMITNLRIEMEGKGTNQVTFDNRANFMMSSNHRDAIRKTQNDRRYCVFYTAQQEFNDIATSGMDGRYFPMLYEWLRAEGYAIVNNYLRTYQIPDHLNPATNCHRAPLTSSTDAAIACSVGSVEQEILEAIAEGVPGLRGGWASSLAVDKRLEDKRLSSRIPRARRRALMQSIGYDWHPGLVNGRVNNPVIDPSGQFGKPVLYIRKDHPALCLTNAQEIMDFYVKCQTSA